MTAQAAFRRMLNEHISPGLRAMGFRGSAGTYEWPDGRMWALVGFQKSAYNDEGHVAFCVYVKVADKHSYADFIGSQDRRPSAISEYAQVQEWHVELGNLIKAHSDELDRTQWWTVTPQSDLEVLADEVLNAIRTHAVPEVQKRLVGQAPLDPPRVPLEDEPL